MVFSSLFFLFVFLPLVLLVYYLAPRRYRNFILFIASLFFYAWGEPLYILLMFFSIVVNYTPVSYTHLGLKVDTIFTKEVVETGDVYKRQEKYLSYKSADVCSWFTRVSSKFL